MRPLETRQTEVAAIIARRPQGNVAHGTGKQAPPGLSVNISAEILPCQVKADAAARGWGDKLEDPRADESFHKIALLESPLERVGREESPHTRRGGKEKDR